MRTANWSACVKEVIINECTKHANVTNAAVSSTLTMATKGKLWQNITEKVNSVGVMNRSVEQVKTKWKNLRSRSIENVRQYQKKLRTTGMCNENYASYE